MLHKHEHSIEVEFPQGKQIENHLKENQKFYLGLGIGLGVGYLLKSRPTQVVIVEK